MSRPLSWAEVEYIEFAARRGHSAMEIADWTGRTPDVIRARAAAMGITLTRDAERGGAPRGNRNGARTWFRRVA